MYHNIILVVKQLSTWWIPRVDVHVRHCYWFLAFCMCCRPRHFTVHFHMPTLDTERDLRYYARCGSHPTCQKERPSSSVSILRRFRFQGSLMAQTSPHYGVLNSWRRRSARATISRPVLMGRGFDKVKERSGGVSFSDADWQGDWAGNSILGAISLAPNDLFIHCRREMSSEQMECSFPGYGIPWYTATSKDLSIAMNWSGIMRSC